MFSLGRKFVQALKERYARYRSGPDTAVSGSGSGLQTVVMVDLWYYDELYPDILQSWTWQTVDIAPEFPRSRAWLSAMAEACSVHHWQIKEFDRRPNYDPRMVHPIKPVEN
jgi:uncharacterized protein Usg